MKKLSYFERGKLSQNAMGQALFELIERKKSPLVVSIDTTKASSLLHMANLVGPYISLLKTHIDILEDFTPNVLSELAELSAKHQFLLFEDRKFTDIGSIAKLQYEKGLYKIANWSHLTSATALAGPTIVEELKKVGTPQQRGLLLVAEMHAYGTLATDEFTKNSVKIAENHMDFVAGFICQKKLSNHPAFIHISPGIDFFPKNSFWRTPQIALNEQGCDMIIVGKSITEAVDPVIAAQNYRAAAWKAASEQKLYNLV